MTDLVYDKNHTLINTIRAVNSYILLELAHNKTLNNLQWSEENKGTLRLESVLDEEAHFEYLENILGNNILGVIWDKASDRGLKELAYHVEHQEGQIGLLYNIAICQWNRDFEEYYDEKCAVETLIDVKNQQLEFFDHRDEAINQVIDKIIDSTANLDFKIENYEEDIE